MEIVHLVEFRNRANISRLHFFTNECCLHGNTEENLVGRVVDTVTPKSTLNIVQTYSALPECSSGFQVSSENAQMIKHILSRSLLALHC